MTILAEANKLIYGDRAEQYGRVTDNFGNIAALIGAYLGVELTVNDVANIMILMKVARGKQGYHKDTYTDIAGYAGCAAKAIEEGEEGHKSLREHLEDCRTDRAENTPITWPSLDDVPISAAVHSSEGTYWSFWTNARALAEGKPELINPGSPGSWLWSREYSITGGLGDRKGPFTFVENVEPYPGGRE